MKIENLSPGQIVYDVHKYQMGNTTIKSVGVWPVKIIAINLARRTVTAFWNGNQAKEFRQSSWSKWRDKKPQLIRGAMGNYHLAKRGMV